MKMAPSLENISQPSSQSTAALDPFDPERLRISQDYLATAGVKKAILTVPVKKPAREWFCQTHPGESFRLQTAVLELKEDRETYLVDPCLWSELQTEPAFGMRALFTAMTRQGVLFVWPIRLPSNDGRIDEWSRSALEAADLATKSWVRVVANMHLGAYDVLEATAELPPPAWPEISFRDILSIAFKDKRIDSLDHPVLKRLRGEL
jgi:hypothetical protein